MSAPAIIRSFIGGLGLSLSVHSFLRWNGRVFGVSGFIHRGIRGFKEEIASVAGLFLGGCLVGILEGHGPDTLHIRPLRIILAGLLVGAGTKLGNGCTSGHMICGISRISQRSIVSTCTFMLTAAITTRMFHNDLVPPPPYLDWTLGQNGVLFLFLQLLPLAIVSLFPSSATESPLKRKFSALATATSFAIALHLGNLTSPHRVLGFLLMPFHKAFDPSLLFLAMSVLPSTMALYHFFRGNERPKFGGLWQIPQGGSIDTQLVLGAVLFGVGWAISGICPAPAVINLGRTITNGGDIRQGGLWLVSMLLGGSLV